MATFIRQTILDQCKKVLGKEGFNEIMANQLNSVLSLKGKRISLYSGLKIQLILRLI